MRFTLCMLALAPALAAAPALAEEPPGSHAAERAALFAEADADHDGMLTKEEFETLGTLMRAHHAERRFAKLDTNGDGLVSADELAAARPHCGHREPPS